MGRDLLAARFSLPVSYGRIWDTWKAGDCIIMRCAYCQQIVAPDEDVCTECGAVPYPGIPAEVQERVRLLFVTLRAQRGNKRIREAYQTAFTIKELAPGCAEVYALLGGLAEEQGLWQDAFNWYQIGVRLAPTRQDLQSKYDAVILRLMPPPPAHVARTTYWYLVPVVLLCVVAVALWFRNFRPNRAAGSVKPIAAGTTEGTRAVNGRDGAEIVWVPTSTCQMGAPAGQGAKDEYPQHQVTLDGFWLYRGEVTVAQFRVFCRATRHAMPSPPPWGWMDNHPIANVTWNEAASYARWAGGALPTEAQWERAARGPAGHVYPWGDTWDQSRCNNGLDPIERTSVTGVYPDGASACGAVDMAGNVAEWCADWYDADYYAHSPALNPHGPAHGMHRALRGGSWNDKDPSYFRCGIRNDADPSGHWDNVGFRCVIAPAH